MSSGGVGDMASGERSPEAAASGVDLYVQARKALSMRSPFDGEEAAARVPTLPARLASWAGQGDVRKKHKKAQPLDSAAAEHLPQPVAVSAASAGIWEQFEVYFREINMDDIEAIVPKCPFNSNKLDSCLLIPLTGSCNEVLDGVETETGHSNSKIEKAETFDVPVSETSSNLGVGGQKLVINKEVSEQSVEQDMHEVVVQQEEQPLEVVEQAGNSDVISPECREDADTSLNWLLGAKDRFVLTSERPNKKRKLLGMDAGLVQLVLLPRLEGGAESKCDVCCLGESGMTSNRMLCCNNCKLHVHQKCYGVHVMPDGEWLCAWCKHLESAGRTYERDAGCTPSMPCVFCPKENGALKPVKMEPGQTANGGNLKFVHLFCSLWAPEVIVEDIESMEPVTNITAVQENRLKLVCNICKVKHGACVRCSHGTCRTSFHPICARDSNHQMEIWGKSGHHNVELRAFCLKHSAVGGIGSVQKSKNAAMQNSAVARPKDANLVTEKIPILRFTRKNKDKFVSYENTNSSPGNLIKVETVELDTLPCIARSVDSQAIQSTEMDMDCCPSEFGNLMRNSGDVAAVLRKLIDRGKVSVSDIASEVGISSESFEAALVGETTTFSPGLKLKIIKWLQNSLHMPAVQVKALKGSSMVLQDDKLDGIEGMNAVNVKSSIAPDDDKEAAADMPDSVAMKSSPPRTKDNDMILRDNKRICSTRVTPLQNGKKKVVKEAADGGCSPIEDIEKGANKKLSMTGSKDSLKKVHQKLISNSMSGNKEVATSLDIPNENEGTLLRRKTDDLSEAQLCSGLKEGVSSLDHCFSQSDNANNGANLAENGICSHVDFDADQFSGQPFLNFNGSHSYIHPFIKKKLAHMWDYTFKQKKRATYYHEDSSCTSHDKHVDSSIKLEQTSDTAAANQVSKAKSLGILEHSPDDEVEGEIVYLQARLLNNAFAIKQRYEDLILKVVRNLSHELDVFNKRKWDLILVNQFLRDVREAKKRGRKERRHKEAQAVLAAAAAAVASSSRNSSVRKDADDNAVAANQESPPKLGTASSRVGQRTSSLPRTKDLSRLSSSKVSPDTNFGIFHIPNFSKENALNCDVCLRSETVLNRIFVCSSCKAAVHLDCYQSLKSPTGPWKCELCEEMSSQAASTSNQSDCSGTNSYLVQCALCCGTSGAFRKTTDGQWVHAFCAEWLLETKFTRGQDNPVDGMDSLLKDKDTCSICLRNVGTCLKCNAGGCHITFHPSCARGAGFYMNVKGFGGMLQHKAYCGNHSTEQREADSQQYGPEELKSMKRMRVELEKLRLLCERIIKREKLKRDLVVCAHDILVRTKDHATFSCYAPGASSESATTSINNKSYSGTIQRSDDVTVDSTVSGKHTIRFALHNRDADRNTADSSTSLLSFKRKLGDRGSLAGKQLPQRPVTNLQKLEDGEKNPKDKMHRETFQKELVMTSDQASTQNQRLPKGYVYVPRDSLAKEKPCSRHMETHEPEEPGG